MTRYTADTLEALLSEAAEEKGCSLEELQYNIIEDLTEEGGKVTADVFNLDDVKEFIFDYLGEYFTSIDFDIEVAIEEKPDGFVINMNAENNSVLIGKMGKTLAAFNTLIRAAVNSQFKKRIEILIDVNSYKEERYAKLRSIAKRTAKQVQRSHVDAEMDPMPNDERKVIHQLLNNWHNIRTESEGQGAARHICIKYVPDEASEEE